MALAGLAAGADGLLIEIHPEPDRAMSDGAQSLDFAGMEKLLDRLRSLAPEFGRTMP
jgi:3-deoxy-7-phosphoheptulonate synthase